MPDSIKHAVDQPPICDIVKVVGKKKVIIFIKIELIKLNDRVTFKINTEQMDFISTQLVEMFPNESLVDFKLCFERGAIGQYGKIYGMDGIVLRQWMEKYLLEKYQVVEDNWKEQKEKEKKKIVPVDGRDWLKEWQKSIDSLPHARRFDLTQKEIEAEGQEKPKTTAYPSTSLEAIYLKKRHLIYVQQNYDSRTGHPLPNWIPEEEFNQQFESGLITGE